MEKNTADTYNAENSKTITDNIVNLTVQKCSNAHCVCLKFRCKINVKVCKICQGFFCKYCISDKTNVCVVCELKSQNKNMLVEPQTQCKSCEIICSIFMCKICNKSMYCCFIGCEFSMATINLDIGYICKNCNNYDNLYEIFSNHIKSQ